MSRALAWSESQPSSAVARPPAGSLPKPAARRPAQWRLRAAISSWLTSFLFHLLALILLALLTVIAPVKAPRSALLVSYSSNQPELETIRETATVTGGTLNALEEETPQANSGPAAELDLSTASESSGGAVVPAVPLLDYGSRFAQSMIDQPGLPGGGGLEGRTPEGRRAAQQGGGATEASESAVERGLRWLQAHQSPDGSWHFDLTLGPCNNYCRNPGTVASTTGATGLALLCFLGAGYTHREGPYAEVVRSGLYYLVGRQLRTPQGGDLQEGTMYAQGIATLALCEAYAMTQDRSLREPAQLGLDFIVYAQDRVGGGWRYFPGQPGDTTMLGWQLMALRSGQLGYLSVPEESLRGASRFLNGVQENDGATYGYQTPGEQDTTTAVGLLCRMYLGWPQSHPALAAGMQFLSATGPSPDNIYYNYYATLALHHYDGPLWHDWNAALQDYLIRTQAQEGHENGSWHFPGGYADKGGRLYTTAMAVLTLEVYYRYLPLYTSAAVEYDLD